MHGPMRLSPVFTRGGRLHRRAATRGYTPDDFARSREVGEGLHELSAAAIPEGNVQGTAAERRSQSQPLSDSLPRPIRGLNCAGSVQLSTPLCTVNSHSDRLHGAALRHVAPRCHLETASHGVTMLYVSPTVSPGRLAATRPPSHPPPTRRRGWRVHPKTLRLSWRRWVPLAPNRVGQTPVGLGAC